MKHSIRNKVGFLIQVSIMGSALFLACASANAISSTTTMTVDENGNYSSDSPFGAVIVSSGVVPIRVGSQVGSALGYQYSQVYPKSCLVPVEGAVYIWDDAAHTILSDVIGFLGDGPSEIYFVSLDSGGDLADASSVPSSLSGLANRVNLTEGANGVTIYTPQGPNGSGAQPGYMDNAGGVGRQGNFATYTFVSSDEAVSTPDGGSTVTLLGLGLAAMGMIVRKIKQP